MIRCIYINTRYIPIVSITTVTLRLSNLVDLFIVALLGTLLQPVLFKECSITHLKHSHVHAWVEICY